MDTFVFAVLIVGVLFSLMLFSLSRVGKPAPVPDVSISDDARLILPLMRAGEAINSRELSARTGLPAPAVLAALRELRASGLANYGPSMDSDGVLKGSGYTLTPDGLAVQRA